ncbi:MAG: CocE/NonD family hydrolase [Bacteroidota bacterium]
MFTDYVSPDRAHYRKIRIESLYIKMRDGVRLAVDILLPAPASAGTRFPVLLHQTRYWRLPELRRPFRWFSQGLLGHEAGYVKELVLSGYVFVNVDCRGSGASFGQRPYPWSPDEIRDGGEVVDWILRQPWANGQVGGVGISYTGTAAEMLLVNQHPAVKGSMALFSLYDVYDDIACPFGIPHATFLREWGRANALLDENRLPITDLLPRLLVRGVKPVGGRRGHRELAAALHDHRENLHVSETSRGIIYRDQPPSNGIVTSMDDFSPHHFQDRIDGSGAAVYSASGWYDGAYPHASIRRYLNSGAKFNRLLLGPWDHGAKYHITPGQSRKLGSEAVREGVRFFDHILKGQDNGLASDPPVRYFTLQQEQWKTAPTWPPPGSRSQTWYLRENGGLAPEPPTESEARDELRHDPAQGTGEATRWACLRSQVKTPNYYPDRKVRDRQLTVYDSLPLAADLTVTGHPVAVLYLRSRAEDGSFFVYLEEVTVEGAVHYITEGGLRALHRNLAEVPEYRDVVPPRTYRQAAGAPLVAGEVARLEFDLLPISYRLRKGSRLRVALATADRDNFAPICPEGSVYELLRDAAHPSGVVLPVMEE